MEKRSLYSKDQAVGWSIGYRLHGPKSQDTLGWGFMAMLASWLFGGEVRVMNHFVRCWRRALSVLRSFPVSLCLLSGKQPRDCCTLGPRNWNITWVKMASSVFQEPGILCSSASRVADYSGEMTVSERYIYREMICFLELGLKSKFNQIP